MSEQTIKLKCTHCNKIFERTLSNNCTSQKLGCQSFCSKRCHNQYQNNKISTQCGQCGKSIQVKPSVLQKSKSGHVFCSRSCSVIYNNQHKTVGVRRSKLEQYIEKQLTILYPDLEILFNDKKTINSELDIYIPSLQLAFELNGIFHYEPIYGESKLNQIQNNDNRKFQACLEKQIELCIIDTSQQKYFKPKTSQKFLNIITTIIDSKR